MRPSDNIPIAAEEVIGFVMITFNALINELSRGIKVAFEEVTNDAVPYGTFHFDERGAQGASELTESTPADQRALHMAYRKFCRCDLFVAFNIKLVEWLLEGYRYKVDWLNFWPDLARLLANAALPVFRICGHSVMQIHGEGRPTLYFDGTGEQFGWPEDSFLLTEWEFMDHLDLQGPFRWLDSDEDRGDPYLKLRPGEFWLPAQARVHKMFKEMDWSEMADFSPGQRVEHIKVVSAKLAADVKAEWDRQKEEREKKRLAEAAERLRALNA